MKRRVAAILLQLTENLQGLVLGRGGEGEKGEVPVLALACHFPPPFILKNGLSFLFLVFQLGKFLQSGLGVAQSFLELVGGLARLG